MSVFSDLVSCAVKVVFGTSVDVRAMTDGTFADADPAGPAPTSPPPDSTIGPGTTPGTTNGGL